MKIKGIEKALRSAKFNHLTEDMLVSYQDQKLNEIYQTQAEAHLDICLICERRLLLLRQERATGDKGEISVEEMALVKRTLNKQTCNCQ